MIKVVVLPMIGEKTTLQMRPRIWLQEQQTSKKNEVAYGKVKVLKELGP
jgi:hypothetical protein